MPQKKAAVNPEKAISFFPTSLLLLGLFILGGSFVYFQSSLQAFTPSETLFIRSCSLLAISLLHCVVLLDPLTKIFPFFKSLYPTRKFAEALLLIFASLHGLSSLFHFHGGGNTPALLSLFLSNTQYGSVTQFPFQVLGFLGLFLLWTMGGIRLCAFVKKQNLNAEKYLHRLIQVVYGIILLHIALGVLQYDTHPFYWTGLIGGAALVGACYLMAYFLPKPITFLPALEQWIIRLGIVGVFIGLPFMSYGIVYWQKPFTAHVYEKEYERTFEGFYFDYPEPLIQLDFGYYDPSLDPEALLVGPEKHGIQNTIQATKSKWGFLNGRKVRIKGKLLYGDRKQMIELSAAENAIEVILNSSYPVTQTRPKTKVLQGEIISSKCWFGYMNPAEGKAHKSCAIRCIESGIPPLLRIQKDGRNNYYILQNKQDNPPAYLLADYVAVPVEITGETFYQNGWNVLRYQQDDIRILN